MRMYEDNSYQSVTYLRAKSKTIRDILIVVFISVFCLTFAIIIFYTTALSGSINKIINTHEKIINEYFKHNPTDNHKIVAEDILSLKKDIDLFFYIYADDKLIGYSDNLYFKKEPLIIPEREPGRIVYFKHNNNNFWGKVLYHNQYRIDMAICINTKINDIIDFCMVLVGCSIIFCIIAWYITKKIANSLLEPLRKSIHQQVLLAQDASHSLKTPIAVIKGEMELLAINPDEKIKNHFENISTTMSMVSYLEKMSNDLLSLTISDVDSNRILEKISINSLLKEIMEIYVDIAEYEEKTFTVNLLATDKCVVWDAERIKKAIIILFDNAFKYTKAGDSIILSVEDRKRCFIISLKDTGIGIKKAQLPLIFNRFYRTPEVISSGIKGSGIGLSILENLSQVVPFELKVESEYQVGSEFKIIIKKYFFSH